MGRRLVSVTFAVTFLVTFLDCGARDFFEALATGAIFFVALLAAAFFRVGMVDAE